MSNTFIITSAIIVVFLFCLLTCICKRDLMKIYANAAIVNENGFTAILNDLRLAFSNAWKFFYSVVSPAFILLFLAMILNSFVLIYVACALIVIVFLYSGAIFGNYNSGIFISSKFNIIDVPARNLENNLIDWFTLKPVRDSVRRKEMKITDINYAHFSTFTTRHFQNSKGVYQMVINHYTLNIAGNFGSIMLDFRTPQKRDELVGYLKQAADDLDHKISIRHI